MKKHVITAMHKCGSSILDSILRSASDANRLTSPYIWKTPKSTNELYIHRAIQSYEKHDTADNYVFIPRNPISICISMFYSFGYTHVPPTKNANKLQKFNRERREIIEMGLEEFVSKKIPLWADRVKHIMCNKYENMTVIPYELMVTDFSKFLRLFLDCLELSELYGQVYTAWSKEFEPQSDMSDKIVAGQVITHKRTTDINEWKAKISQEKLRQLVEKYPIIMQYADFVEGQISK